MDLTPLTKPSKTWLHLLAAPALPYDGLRALGPGVVVCFVRGRKMTTKAGLMDELAAALQFPPHFGENWDALLDGLRDLNAPTVLVVADAGWLLNAAPPDELATF